MPPRLSNVIFPAFAYRRLEAQYQRRQAHDLQSNDAVVGGLVIIIYAVVIKKAFEQGMHLQATYGLLTASLFSIPLLTMATTRYYPALRTRIVVVWLLAGYHYGLKASTVLSGRPVPPAALPLVLLLRSQVVISLWVNLSLRLPFLLHIATHGGCLAIIWMSDAARCKWAVAQAPLEWMGEFVGFMRRVTLVPDLPPDSFAATPVGRCTAASMFFQLVLGYSLPCYICLLMELRSRHAFFVTYHESRRRRGMQALRLRPWRAGRLLGTHPLWLSVAAVLGGWRLADAAAEWVGLP